MHDKTGLLSQLLRDLEAEVGTTDVAFIVLSALIESVKYLKVKDVSDFCRQFCELSASISNIEPKFGILNFYFAQINNIVSRYFEQNEFDEKLWKRIVLKQVKDILREANVQKHELLKYAEQIDVENKTILIHDHARTVHEVLAHYKAMGKHFKVIIAEQSFEKTHVNIEKMDHLQIPFQVVPAYMLSHVHGDINMVFFGALTLKDKMDFVMVPGAHGIISEFNSADIPVYMFINTTKFSLWKSKKKGEIFMHKHLREHYYKPITYERIKYSHDRVPAKFFSKIITNEGIFSPAELKTLFMKKMSEYGDKYPCKI